MSTSDFDIIESSSIGVLVPEDSDFNPAAYFNGSGSEEKDIQSKLSAVTRRSALHFGMLRHLQTLVQSSYSFLGLQ